MAVVPLVVARQVVAEAAQWLGEPLPEEYVQELLFRAEGCFEHALSFRRRLLRSGDEGRDRLYAFMRHWLAACLKRERPDLFHLLPDRYAWGAEPPAPPARARRTYPLIDDTNLSPDARLLAAF